MAGLIGAMCATNPYADISTLIFFSTQPSPLTPLKREEKSRYGKREREKIREKKQSRIIP